jgi:hypothetical protein
MKSTVVTTSLTLSLGLAALIGCGSGSGNNGVGQDGMAGSGGSGGGLAGSGGSVTDASGVGGTGGSLPGGGPDSGMPTDSGTMNPPGGSIDECFANLPGPVGLQQVDSKASADGKIRLRLAFDTEDRGGIETAWALIRFAIEVNGVVTCVKDRQQLNYMVTHHNCLDKASVVAGSVRYDLVAPNFVATQISASMNGASAWGPTTVQTTTCTGAPNPKCLRGGPCQ